MSTAALFLVDTLPDGDVVELRGDEGRHAARVKHIHLKDVRAEVAAWAHQSGASFEQSVRAGVFTVPGDGDVDMRGFLAAAEEIGYEGWMVVEAEQDPAKAPPLEYAKKGREFVREVIGR